MTVRAARAGWAALVLAVLLAASAGARADGGKSAQAAAAALSQEGVQLFDAGDIKAACERFEASLELYDDVTTQGRLATCFESLGRVGSAFQTWRAIAARPGGAEQVRRRTVAREHMEALAPRVPFLTLVLPADARDAFVSADGKLLEGVTGLLPIDPGKHVIAARSVDGRKARVEFSINEGQRRRIVLGFRAGEPRASDSSVVVVKDAPPAEAPTEPAMTSTSRSSSSSTAASSSSSSSSDDEPVPAEPAPEPAPAPEPEPDRAAAADSDDSSSADADEPFPSDDAPPAQRGRWRRTAAIVTMGLGGAGLVTAGILETLALTGDHKTTQVIEDSDLVSTFAIGGGACVAAGLILWLTRPTHHERRVAAAPLLGPGVAGLAMAGQF
ncbi:MAG: hypothetical protein IT370_05095 [Deltaproteobacteria bacterium]|nr:hypothetical protein [Deltaproteobacteria bacterium]